MTLSASERRVRLGGVVAELRAKGLTWGGIRLHFMEGRPGAKNVTTESLKIAMRAYRAHGIEVAAKAVGK